MPFNFNTPKLPGLPRLGGGSGSGSQSRRDLEEEERRRRMLRGAGGLGGLGGAAPPRRAQPQRSAMFQKAGGLPSLPRRMETRDLPSGGGWADDDTDADAPFVLNPLTGAGTKGLGHDPGGTGGTSPVDEDTDLEPYEGEGSEGGIEEDEIDPEIDPDYHEELLDEMAADDPSELDALFEDIIEGLESDIPEIRQNAMNEMNAALRRQAEINSLAGRGIGGGFGGAMGATTARGLEGLARAEGAARSNIRNAQLGWLDRRLRQQGMDETEEREMRMAILDMLKDVDPETLEERYGTSDLGEIMEQIMGSDDGDTDFGSRDPDAATWETNTSPLDGGIFDEGDMNFNAAGGSFDLDTDDGALSMRFTGGAGSVHEVMENMRAWVEEQGWGYDFLPENLAQTMGPDHPIVREIAMFSMLFKQDKGRVPNGGELWEYLEREGIELAGALLDEYSDDWRGD